MLLLEEKIQKMEQKNLGEMVFAAEVGLPLDGDGDGDGDADADGDSDADADGHLIDGILKGADSAGHVVRDDPVEGTGGEG